MNGNKKPGEPLKPCPFCGQEHTTITESNTEGIRIRMSEMQYHIYPRFL